MKRYKFRLETVLRVRRLQEDQAKNALMEANHNLLVAQNQLAVKQSRYAEIQSQLGTVSADEFARARWSWEQAARAIEVAQELVVARAADVASARDAFLAASRAVEVLERLDQRRREEYDIEAARAEIAEVDDIVNGRRAFVLQASAS